MLTYWSWIRFFSLLVCFHAYYHFHNPLHQKQRHKPLCRPAAHDIHPWCMGTHISSLNAHRGTQMWWTHWYPAHTSVPMRARSTFSASGWNCLICCIVLAWKVPSHAAGIIEQLVWILDVDQSRRFSVGLENAGWRRFDWMSQAKLSVCCSEKNAACPTPRGFAEDPIRGGHNQCSLS